MGDRWAVLVASKGLVPPLGTTPAAYVAERVRARAVATLAGPAHAREAIELGASVVVATRDADLRRQLRDLLEAGGLTVEATDDVTGAELAACAKNAAALATAAAAARGAEPRRRRRRARLLRDPRAGASRAARRSETFAGLAGAGDLVATALAEGSRNRRAGEMVGRGRARPARCRRRWTRPPSRSRRCRCSPTRSSARASTRRSPTGLRRVLDGRGLARAVARDSSIRAARAAPHSRGLGPGVGSDDEWRQTAVDKERLDRDFTELYRAHLRDVYSYAYYRVGNHHDAEDLTEQTFLQAYRHFERAQRESDGRPLRPWLIRIAHNLAANYYRDRSRRPQTQLDDASVLLEPHGTEELVRGARGGEGGARGRVEAPGRPPRGADHALRARHGQPRDRARAGPLRGRDQGVDPQGDQAARGGPRGGRVR